LRTEMLDGGVGLPGAAAAPRGTTSIVPGLMRCGSRKPGFLASHSGHRAPLPRCLRDSFHRESPASIVITAGRLGEECVKARSGADGKERAGAAGNTREEASGAAEVGAAPGIERPGEDESGGRANGSRLNGAMLAPGLPVLTTGAGAEIGGTRSGLSAPREGFGKSM
jgi:hypothetical protein